MLNYFPFNKSVLFHLLTLISLVSCSTDAAFSDATGPAGDAPDTTKKSPTTITKSEPAAPAEETVTPGTPAEPTRKIIVEILGLKDTSGNLCVSMFADADGFPDATDKAVTAECVAATRGNTLEISVPATISEGAIAFFHDSDSDGRLSKGIFGIPKEGFGFSNDPEVKTSAPSYEECKIDLGANGTTNVKITTRYLF